MLAILAVLLAAGGWWVNRALEPNRLTALVLERAGNTLGLELTINGTPEYALRPEPRLVLPNLTVRQPGAAAPLLTAVRAEVSLPWDTITGGESLVITRIALQRPALDLAALSDWQASRPPAPFELPTLTDGLHVQDGSVVGGSWRLEALQLDLPELRNGEPVRAAAAGRFSQAETVVEFDITANLATASLASDYELAGKGQLRSDGLDVPWVLATAGRFDSGDKATRLDVSALVLTSQSPLPNLDASGHVVFADAVSASFKGTIKEWPEGWPTLPAPMSASTSPLAYTITYEGADDFSAPVALAVVRDETRFEGRFVVAEVTTWIDAAAATPLPPLVGTLSTPSVEIAGATLEGVSIQIEEDAPAEPEPKP
ncbi:MAG: hypothetical protein DCF27_05295 [Lysobacteraceae bacterium]|nr:MAG: hypothetical protein DCF27_05295 [Xanthomonadaceae bacterium]